MREITCAAIRTDDGEIHTLPRPNRHHDIIQHLRAIGYDGPVCGERQGFLTSDGIFARRKPALMVAVRAGQVEREKCTSPGHGLFSEDIW